MSAVDPVWAQGMQQFHVECGGVLQLHVVDPVHFLELAAASACGSIHASAMLRAVQMGLDQIAKAPKNRPALCLGCPREIRKPQGAVIVVVVPDDGRAGQAITSALCPRCVAGNADLDAVAFRGLRRLWPDLRPLVVHPESGHA